MITLLDMANEIRTAPDRAKSDLKKQMAAKDVRKAIQAFIIQHLGVGDSKDADLGASIVSVSDHHTDAMSESVISEHPSSGEAPLEPLFVHTQRELEDSFKEMAPPFEGRETEHNWLPRDKAVLKIRRQLKGNAPEDFHVAFVAGIKGMLDNILKVSNTLRTTMSSNGCQLVQELYRTLGSSMDPMTEILIQNYSKMSANTKAIASKNADTTMEIILSNCTYNHRIMNHILQAFQEKNQQTRSFAPGWLKIIIKKNASHKGHIEHGGGIEVIEKCIKKGLEDPGPKVRESTRSAYWTFAQIWPDQAARFLAGLEDNKMRTALEKDPNNPNKPVLASSVSSVATQRLRPAASKPSIRDAIAAQRRAALSKSMPDRPNSAASILTVNDQATSKATSSRHIGARPPSSLNESVQPPAIQRGLTAAPAKRPRRPEINRPATADPYATRKVPVKTSTPTMSPQSSPSKTTTTASKTAGNTIRAGIGRTPARPAAQSVSSTVRSKTRVEQAPVKASPVPPREASHIPLPHSSPSKDENMTMVIPFSRAPEDDHHSPHQSRLPIHRKSHSRDSGASKLSEGEAGGFTMVLPTFRPELGDRPSPARPSSSGSMSKVPMLKRSPLKLANENIKPGSPLVSHTPSKSSNTASSLPQTVQVYEDPFQSEDPAPTSLAVKPVLEEIAINERSSDAEREERLLMQSTRSNEQNISFQNTPRHTKTTSTGSILGVNNDSEALSLPVETARNRRLLTSAIDRVRSKTLDAHGFRRVQELVRSNSDIWGSESEKYADLLLALLDYLEAPSDSLKVTGTPAASKVQNLKTQVLATIRAMLALHKREASPFYAKSLTSVLRARNQFDEVSHIAAEMDKLAEEIVRNARSEDCILAILTLLDSFSASPSETNNSRSITMSLAVLSSLLSPPAPSRIKGAPGADVRNSPLGDDITRRLGQMAVRLLEDSNPEVRRADLEFCIVLHERLGGEGAVFWSSIQGAKESGLNLITYYLARRGKA